MKTKICFLSVLILCSSKISSAKNVDVKKSHPVEVNQLVEPINFVPNNEISVTSLEETIREVEATLKANPKLPRLTRGEILDLLENITKSDPNLKIQVPSKGRQSKAVMKVLPFTPDGNNFNVEDLYTKPPLTQIVASQDQDQNLDENNVPQVHNSANKFKKIPSENVKKGNRHRNKLSTSTSFPLSSTESLNYNCKDGDTECNLNYSTENKRLRKPSRFQSSTSTSTISVPPSTSAPRRRRPTDIRRKPTKSTSAKFSNHKYEDESPEASSVSTSSTLYPSDGIKIISPPSLPPNVINEDLFDLKKQNQKQQTLAEEHSPVVFKLTDLSVGDDDSEGNEGVPLVVDIPEHLKGILGELNLAQSLKNLPKATPTKPTLKPVPSPTIASLPDIEQVADDTLTPEMKDLLRNFGLIPNNDDKNTEPSPSESQIYFDSYKPEVADIQPSSYGGFKPLPNEDNTREEMKELLARFGLDRSTRSQKSLDYKKKGSNNNQMELPKEFEKVLDDIGWTNTKSDKSETVTKKHVFNPSENLSVTSEEIEKLNRLSDTVKQLESLNRPLTPEDFKKIDVETLKTLVKSLNNSFLPLDEQNAPDPLFFDYELVKNEVKRQENTSKAESSPDTSKAESSPDISKAESSPDTSETESSPDTSKAESSPDTSKTESSPDTSKTESSPDTSKTEPSPDKSKGETSADTSKTESSPDTSKAESSPDTSKAESSPDTSKAESSPSGDSATPNIKDLEDSFGGAAESTTETTPPIKQTGFYYLFDWNTFLDIDDQKGKRVNLRFQPKAGDPKRFYSVHVP